MSVAEFLKTAVPFLNGLDEEQARALAASAQERTFGRGQTVLFKGVTVDGLHVVASGKVSVHVKTDKSRPPVQVAELGPGEVFGETSILEMGTAGATVKAADDGTHILIIPQDAFRGVLDRNAEFRARAQALIAARKKSSSEARPSAPPA